MGPSLPHSGSIREEVTVVSPVRQESSAPGNRHRVWPRSNVARFVASATMSTCHPRLLSATAPVDLRDSHDNENLPGTFAA